MLFQVELAPEIDVLHLRKPVFCSVVLDDAKGVPNLVCGFLHYFPASLFPYNAHVCAVIELIGSLFEVAVGQMEAV